MMKEWLKDGAMVAATALPIIDGLLLFFPGLPLEARITGLALLCPSAPCALWIFAEGLSTHLHPEYEI